MMKKISLLVMGLCMTQGLYAEVRPLPPVINNSTYMDGTPYRSNRATSNKPILDMLGRVDSVEAEIQQLRGLIEQQKHDIEKMLKREQNMYRDINERFQTLESGVAPKQITDYSISGIKKRGHQAIKLGENLAIPLADRRAEQQKVVANTKVFVHPNEKVAFNKAYEEIRQNQLPKAIKLFTEFLSVYPSGDYSDNALFWRASASQLTGQFEKAKRDFKAILTQFPSSDKASSAMLKLADIYLDEQNKKQALYFYQKIVTSFPNTTEAHLAEKQLTKGL